MQLPKGLLHASTFNWPLLSFELFCYLTPYLWPSLLDLNLLYIHLIPTRAWNDSGQRRTKGLPSYIHFNTRVPRLTVELEQPPLSRNVLDQWVTILTPESVLIASKFMVDQYHNLILLIYLPLIIHHKILSTPNWPGPLSIISIIRLSRWK